MSDRIQLKRPSHTGDTQSSQPIFTPVKPSFTPTNQPIQAPLLGHDFSRISIQPKLTVSQPDDPYEQEADRVADEVMRMQIPESNQALMMRSLGERIDRKCPTCEDEEKVQLKSGNSVLQPDMEEEEEAEKEEDQAELIDAVSQTDVEEKDEEDEEEPIQMKSMLQRSSNENLRTKNDLESRLSNSKAGGSPLPDEVQSFMEPRFGANFSQVRVHTGGDAVQMNQELSAQAFTHGSHIYYGAGKTPAKDKLTGHELTHVIQQTGSLQRKGTVDNSVSNSLTSSSVPTTESILQTQGLGVRGQGIQYKENSSAKDNNSAQLSIQTISKQKVMRNLALDSTVQICRRVLTTRKVQVSQGGLRVVLALKPLNTETPDCHNHDFGVTLTKSVDLWFDDEIATCTADTGGTRSFSFKDLPSGTYYLTISRTLDNPYCCMEGDILVFDEPISGDSSGCIRDKDPSTMDIVRGALDIAGFIPVLGAIPDGINATIYVAEGDWVNAGISAFAMIPAIGDGAKAGVMAGKAVVKVSEKTALKLGEEGLAKAFKEAKAVSKAEEAAKAASKLEKEAAEAAEKAAKEAAAKAIQKKIERCLAIYAAKEALPDCRKCRETDTLAERAAKIACLTAEIGFREAYLKEDCDDVLQGSIDRKKRGDDPKKGHETQLAQKIRSLVICSTLPTK